MNSLPFLPSCSFKSEKKAGAEMVCLCIVMSRINLLWYVTWPAQETLPGAEKGLRNTNQNMATVANFRLFGLGNVLYFSYFYLFIYLCFC